MRFELEFTVIPFFADSDAEGEESEVSCCRHLDFDQDCRRCINLYMAKDRAETASAREPEEASRGAVALPERRRPPFRNFVADGRFRFSCSCGDVR